MIDNHKKIMYDDFKIVLTGDYGTGKTSFIKKIIFKHYSITPEPKYIESTRQELTVKGKTVMATIWDTFGWEKYCAISARYYRYANAAMLFYDITDLNSFNSLKKWLDDIYKYAEPDVVIMLIGNKCDSLETERQVSTEIGKNYAKQHNLLFCEMSVRKSINIEEALMQLLEKTVSKLEDKKEEEEVKKSMKDQPITDSISFWNIKC